MSEYHQPVMLQEVLELLTEGGHRGGLFVDATLGGGGHAEGLLAFRDDIRVIGVDQDPEAITAATSGLERFGGRFRAMRANFRGLHEALSGEKVDGVLMDLGVSSHQLDTPERGFSFQREGPLDMRMDPEGDLTAEKIVNRWDEVELARIFWELGDERFSRRIARRIVEARKGSAIRGTSELAELVARAIGRRGRIHPATRVFQALRLAVNDELGSLAEGLKGAWSSLKQGGRLAVISFHSLEDRIVKNQFRTWGREEKTGTLLSKKPLAPSEEEAERNPRARSAKLRGIEKN